jgi:tRNA (cmo5U34)-methyltransferase
MTGSIDVFAAHATEYHDLRRRLVPGLDTFYGTAADLLDQRGGPVARVLDLGAGTGLLSAAVLTRHPDAELVLLDGAPQMLAEAGKHLPTASITTQVGDLREPLPQGPFDAVVSALAIHHLEHDEKRDLFERIVAVLRPGGVFVNAEQVCGAAPWQDALLAQWWRRDCRAAEATEAEIAAAEVRMLVDRCADVAGQLRWMREAGLQDADCFYRQSRFAVLAGWRAA